MRQFETDQALRDMAIAAVQVEGTSGFPAAVTLAFWAVESQWGAALSAAFNYWGITRLPEEGPAEMCPTHEDISPAQLAGFDPREQATAALVMPLPGGKVRYSMKRYFAAYGSLAESVEAFVEFFTKSPHRYVAAWAQYQANHNADALLKSICEAGYATDSASEGVRLSIAHQSNITHAVEMARAAVPTVTT
jgi:flagellum-specific peptidoglycan hydrolase FlgJ